MSGGFLIFASSHLISVSHFPCFCYPPKITTTYSIKRWKMPKQHPTALVPSRYWATSAVFNLNPGAHCHPVVTCCNQVWFFFFKQHAFLENQHYKIVNKDCFDFSFQLYIVSIKFKKYIYLNLKFYSHRCLTVPLQVCPSIYLSVFLFACLCLKYHPCFYILTRETTHLPLHRCQRSLVCPVDGSSVKGNASTPPVSS